MPKEPKVKSVLAEARAWAARNKLFGTQAFLRYVILNFAEKLNEVSDDLVFKGGNLLWIYIGTPRATTDLDLATLETSSHSKVRQALEKACATKGEIRYSIRTFKEIEQEGKTGAALTVGYTTNDGASNVFEVDIVYALSADVHEIRSPVHPEATILSATVENIIADKLAACARFKAGNSRMKDFDDLWRLSMKPDLRVDGKRLKKLLKQRKIAAELDRRWMSADLARLWKSHRARYRDLPETIDLVFEDVNRWLVKEADNEQN